MSKALTKLPAPLQNGVTREEIINLILEDTEKELAAEVAQAREAEKKVEEPPPDLIDIIRLTMPDDPEITYTRQDYEHNGIAKGSLIVSAEWVIKPTAVPAAYKSWQRHKEAAQDKRLSAQRRLNDVKANRGRIKNELVRRALQSTPDGQQVLKAADEFRKYIRKQTTEKEVPS